MGVLSRTAAIAVGAISVAHLVRRIVRGRPLDFDGKVVLITGGSRGLGLVLARHLARRGCRIAICARDPEGLEKARQDLEDRGAEVFAHPCDVSQPEQVRELVDAVETHFGDIDVLINNASIIQVGPVEAMTAEDFERAVAVNFWGTFHTTMAVLPRMRERRDGRIVNVTSIGGKVAVPHLLPYSVGKFAAVGFSEGLASEVAKDGIKITTVVPGLMRTGSPANALFKSKADEEFTWFTLGDSLPISSMSAERAARRIVRALRRGEAEVTLSWQAKLVRLTHGIFPAAVIRGMGWATRLLPEPGGIGKEERRGMDLATNLAPSRLTWLSNRAARRNNEYGGAYRPKREHARGVGMTNGASQLDPEAGSEPIGS